MATVSLAKLAITVVADSKGAVKNLGVLEQTSKRLRKKFGTLEAGTVSLRGAMSALAGAAGLAYVSKELFELGSAAVETQSKFVTTFGQSALAAQDFIDEFGTIAGLTRSSAQDILATTGAIAQGMGFAQEASAEFAMQAVELAGDLSSFNNVPVADTARAIQAAVTGEREQLKRLGIVVREVDVQQRAMAMSGKTNAKMLTDTERAAATMSLVAERAGVAVGDLARTQESAANRARALGAQFGNVREALAVALIPAFEVLLEEMGGSISGMGQFVEKLRGSGNVIGAWARVAVESFKFAFDAIQLVIMGAFNLGQTIGEVLRGAFALLRGDLDGAKEALSGVGREMGQQRDLALDLWASFESIQNASGMAFETVAEGAMSATQEIQAMQAALIGEGSGLSTAQEEILGMSVGLRDVSGWLNMIPADAIELAENLKPIGQGMRTAVEESGEFQRIFADAAVQSGLSFRKFASTVIAEMQRIALKKAALKIFDFLAGGPLSTFAGLFDEGGKIPAGQVGIVGERGPELVRGPANVTGREETAALAGSGGSTINIALVAAGSGQVVDRVRYQTDRDEQKGREVRIPIRAGVLTR